MQHSPLMLMMALAHYGSTDPAQHFPPPTWDSSAGREARKFLKQLGMVDDDGQGTPKLAFFVEHLCSQPFPVVTYTIPAAGEAR